jgi:prevent-host-death family protein
MQTIIPIGDFKTHCNKIISEAQDLNQEVTITRKGKIIAKVIPVSEKSIKKSIFGMLQAKAVINGNLLEDLNISWYAENE